MTIIVGYVPRDEGRAALRLAADEAKLHGSKLLVVALGSVGEPQTSQSVTYQKGNIEQARAKVAEELTDVEQYLRNADVEYELRPMVSSEDPGDALPDLASQEGAEFIVIGLRRRSAVGKLVFGSNAQRILTNSPCPVIAVHADRPH